MSPVLIVVFLAIAGVIGDFFIKLAGHDPKLVEVKWLVIGSIVYMSTIFGWFYVMRNMKLSSLGVVYALTTILFLVAIGVFYFHEKLNMYEIVGIITAITSLALLSRFA